MSWTYVPPAQAVPSAYVAPRISTSRKELTHLVIAYVVLTVDIAIILVGAAGGLIGSVRTPGSLLLPFGVGAAAAATGFVAHEMAHKIAAQRRRYWAEFRMFPMGLLLSLVTSFAGFLFAMPGATMVQQISDRRDFGWTSLAGPVTNLVEGGAFASIAFALFWWNLFPVIVVAFFLLAFFNGWFAAFNLLPFGPLDGAKVFRWNRGIWIVGFVVALGFTILTYLVTFARLLA